MNESVGVSSYRKNKSWISKATRWYDNSPLFSTSLLVPVLIFFIVWNVIPTLWMVGLGFYNYSLITGNPEKFIGLKNFLDIAVDDTVWHNFGRTFLWVVMTTGIETLLGILLGFLFWGSAKLPGRRLALTLLFTPMLLAPVSTGTFFRLIYDPIFGVLNDIIIRFGGEAVDFLGNLKTAFPSVMMVDIWMWTPFMIMITLAALGSVPKAELEAAEIDRLPWYKRLTYIVWPYGKFVIMLGILLRTIDSFKTMDLVNQMTKGGPGNTTELIALGLYRKAFEGFNMGWSSALALVLFFTAIAFTSLYLFVLNQSNKQKQEG